MESHIFVYGTLRRDVLGRDRSPLTRGWTFAGYGSVRGELYDFGAYPGAVPSSEPGAKVRGELYRVPDPAATLPLVDHYEGCGAADARPYEFERDAVDVEMDDGGRRRAWIYWYRPSPPRGRRLESGDYVERTRLDEDRA